MIDGDDAIKLYIHNKRPIFFWVDGELYKHSIEDLPRFIVATGYFSCLEGDAFYINEEYQQHVKKLDDRVYKSLVNLTNSFWRARTGSLPEGIKVI